jgi:hypothetical protein
MLNPWTLFAGARARRLLCLAMLSAALTGCSTVDSFGPRAIIYNQQMQQSRKALILQNVLRAAYDQPLQFSETSTVTGQASAQGSITSSLPFVGRRGTQSQLFSLSPGAQVTAGPAFNVANLDTQEFFSGITKPVSADILGQYITVGYRRLSLMPLLIESIEFDQGGHHFLFVNDPAQKTEYNTFMSVLQNMHNSGLSFENPDTATPVGPPLTAADLRDGRVLSMLIQTASGEAAASSLSLKTFKITDAKAGLSDREVDALKAQKVDTVYRLIKTEKRARPCFAIPGSITTAATSPTAAAPAKTAITINIYDYDHTQVFANIGRDLWCGAKPVDESAPPASSTAAPEVENFKITTRSVRGAFAYLGQMAQLELPSSPSALDVPIGEGVYLRTFGIELAKSGQGDVVYEGRAYRLTHLAKGEDDSERSVQLLSELIALYSSAKSLPTPNIIPFFTP